MALAKRRDEVQNQQLIHLQFLDIATATTASVVIGAYTVYTTSAEVTERGNSENLYLASFFVIIGVVPYLKIAFIKIRQWFTYKYCNKRPFYDTGHGFRL